jgi:hypothetical protein
VYMVLVGKPEGKRLLGSSRRRWEDGIKKDLREITLGGGGGMVSPGSGYGSLAGCCECGDELSGSGTTELAKSTAWVSIHSDARLLFSLRPDRPWDPSSLVSNGSVGPVGHATVA